jgi:hypothetical protein
MCHFEGFPRNLSLVGPSCMKLHHHPIFGVVCTAMHEILRALRKSSGGSLSDETLCTPVALGPLSSLPRDGGDVRGGSFLVAALPRHDA